MAKKKPTKKAVITTDHVISTLVYIKNLTEALIATLMAQTGTDFPQLPPPVSLGQGYDKDCPPPEDRGQGYDKDCPPPEDRGQGYDKDCPPPEDDGGKVYEKGCRVDVPTPTRFIHCPTLVVKVPKPSVRQAHKPGTSKKPRK